MNGTNHFFDVLDITPLQDLVELGKTENSYLGIQ